MLRVEAGEAHNLKIVRLSQKGVESAVAGAEKDKEQTKKQRVVKRLCECCERRFECEK